MVPAAPRAEVLQISWFTAVILHLSIITVCILLVCNSLHKSITVKSCHWSACLETTWIYKLALLQCPSGEFWLIRTSQPCTSWHVKHKINTTRGRWFPGPGSNIIQAIWHKSSLTLERKCTKNCWASHHTEEMYINTWLLFTHEFSSQTKQ